MLTAHARQMLDVVTCLLQCFRTTKIKCNIGIAVPTKYYVNNLGTGVHWSSKHALTFSLSSLQRRTQQDHKGPARPFLRPWLPKVLIVPPPDEDAIKLACKLCM